MSLEAKVGAKTKHNKRGRLVPADCMIDGIVAGLSLLPRMTVRYSPKKSRSTLSTTIPLSGRLWKIFDHRGLAFQTGNKFEIFFFCIRQETHTHPPRKSTFWLRDSRNTRRGLCYEAGFVVSEATSTLTLDLTLVLLNGMHRRCNLSCTPNMLQNRFCSRQQINADESTTY